ncbi:MAG: LysR family transcriptional regulator [Pseudomonadota bacterium]
MNIQKLDLNLLVVFDAVYRERHVSRAAERMGMSQPTMSNALSRLRRMLGDPLFIKSRNGVIPTAYADAMAPKIAEAIGLIKEGLKASAFDPATEKRSYTLALSDIAEASVLPEITRLSRTEAPYISFKTEPLTRTAMEQGLANGQIDLAIGYLLETGSLAYQQTLFQTRYVCLHRRNHPLIGKRMTKKAFLNAEHAVAGPDYTGHSTVANTMSKLNLSRGVSINASRFLALPFIAAETDCIALVPETLARKMKSGLDLVSQSAPIDLPPIDVRMFWHERSHQDPANAWLREMVRRAFSKAKLD